MSTVLLAPFRGEPRGLVTGPPAALATGVTGPRWLRRPGDGARAPPAPPTGFGVPSAPGLAPHQTHLPLPSHFGGRSGLRERACTPGPRINRTTRITQ